MHSIRNIRLRQNRTRNCFVVVAVFFSKDTPPNIIYSISLKKEITDIKTADAHTEIPLYASSMYVYGFNVIFTLNMLKRLFRINFLAASENVLYQRGNSAKCPREESILLSVILFSPFWPIVFNGE